MGQSTFPAPSTGASYSSQPPANASSVLLDGSLVNSASYSTTLTGTGASWLLYANGAGTTTFTVGSDTYSVTAGSTVGTSAYTGSQSVTVNGLSTSTPTPFVLKTLPASTAYGYITYGNGKFVVTNSLGTTAGAYSTDGATWTASTMLYGGPITYGTISGTGYFIAVAGNNSPGNGEYSTNGYTWTSVSIGVSTYGKWKSIAYNNGVFLTLTDGGTSNSSNVTAYSTNATTWTFGSTGDVAYYNFCIGANGYFLTGPDSNQYFRYSSNGTSWTSAAPGGSGVGGWMAAAYGNGTWVSIQQNGTSAGTYSTVTPPNSWSTSTMPSTSSWKTIAFGNGYFVALISNSTTGAYSTNGITWSAVTMPSGDSWNNLAYGNGKMVGTSNTSTSRAAFYSWGNLPVAYGIYNGPTATH